MKNNKKGFTLIELLAVIVILAIIMVIAVPRILDVINNSRNSAWNSNCKLVKEAIDLNTTLSTTGMSSSTFSLASTCTGSDVPITTGIASIADISATDTTVTCSRTGEAGHYVYTVTVTPTDGGQFAGRAAQTFTY